MLKRSPNFKQGQLVGERYKIKKSLSTAGLTCIVYSADDIKENKRVVLKVFKSTWREVRIKREILAMKGLDHPGIIKLLDYHLAEDKDDYSYLVMDEIEQA